MKSTIFLQADESKRVYQPQCENICYKVMIFKYYLCFKKVLMQINTKKTELTKNDKRCVNSVKKTAGQQTGGRQHSSSRRHLCRIYRKFLGGRIPTQNCLLDCLLPCCWPHISTTCTSVAVVETHQSWCYRHLHSQAPAHSARFMKSPQSMWWHRMPSWYSHVNIFSKGTASPGTANRG